MADFILLQKWLNPTNEDHILLVANRIAAIRYGDEHGNSPPVVESDGAVHIHPSTNDHWLYPPRRSVGQPKGYWRLIGRYDSPEDLEKIVDVLKRFL